jgi:hypothetical protein
VQSEISPRRSRNDGTFEVGLLRDAHRNVAIAQNRKHLVIEPALVPKLESVSAIDGQITEEILQPLDVLLEIRRKLKENRPESVAKDGGVLQ